MIRSRVVHLFVISVLINAGNVFAADESIENLSNKLIELRTEVERLNNEINFAKEEHKQEMNYLWTQKNDMQAELERNDKSLQKLQTQLDKKIAENSEKGKSSEELKPVFMQQIDYVHEYINTSIPFKKSQRLADLKDLQDQVNQNLISTQRGFNKLWALIEDEIRLTKETGLYKQTIAIEGLEEKKLVDIVRLGMMNIYFSTPEGEYGKLARTKDNWVFEISENIEDKKQISELFDSLGKQVRTGLFTLPMSQN